MSEPETELAARVVAWLSEMGWTVYQEVQMRSHGKRADIVAVLGKVSWVVECKTSLSLDVIQQAIEWDAFANFRSIAIPKVRRSIRETICRFARFNGFGIIESGYDIHEAEPARLNRNPIRNIREAVCEEHKTFSLAGNANCDFYSPFKETIRKVVEYVKANPGSGMKQIVDGIKDHHYASGQSARCAIAKWIQLGRISGIESYQDGNRTKYRQVTQTG
jgi:hypothetical protein